MSRNSDNPARIFASYRAGRLTVYFSDPHILRDLTSQCGLPDKTLCGVWTARRQHSWPSFVRGPEGRLFKQFVRSLFHSVVKHFDFRSCKRPIRSSLEHRFLVWEEIATLGAQRIDKSTIFLDGTEMLCAYNTALISQVDVDRYTQDLAAFYEEFKPDTHTTEGRGRHVRNASFHGSGAGIKQGLAFLGNWNELGHHNNEVRVTKDSVSSEQRYTAAQRLFRQLEDLTRRLSAFLCAVCPEYWGKQVMLMEQLKNRVPGCFFSGAWDVFPTRGLLFNLPTSYHIDSEDGENYAVMVCLGSYSGGELVLPDIGVKLAYQPGHVVVLKAGVLAHFVARFTGERYAMVCFVHESVHESLAVAA